MRGAVAFAHCIHICDGIRRSAEAEAAGAGSHDGGFIVASHDAKDDKVGESTDQGDLDEKRQRERYGERGELPELETHKGAGEKDIEAHATQDFAFLLVGAVPLRDLRYIADDGSDDHATDISGEDKTDAAEEGAHIGTDTHSEEQLAESVHEVIHIEVSRRGIFGMRRRRSLAGLFCRVVCFMGDQREAAHQ